MKNRKIHVQFQISIIVVNVINIILLSAVIMGIVLTASTRSSRESITDLFDEIGNLTLQKITTNMNTLLDFAALGAVVGDSEELIKGDGSSHPALPFMRQCLDQESIIYSVYYGKNDGTFLQLINTRDNSRIIDAHSAPGGTHYILRSIVNLPENQRMQHWTFLDSNWKLLDKSEEPNPDYDPRQRPWYKASISNHESSLSEGYIFHSLQKLGITGSKKLINNDGVFGVDITLEELNTFVDEESPSSGGGILLFDQNDRLLAVTEGLSTVLNTELKPLSPVPSSLLSQLQNEGLIMSREYLSLQTTWKHGKNTRIEVLVLSPLSDFTTYLMSMQRRIIGFSSILLLVVLIASIIIFRKLTNMLDSLAKDAERVSRLDFTGEIHRGSLFTEFYHLAEGFHKMKETISIRTEELDTALGKLEKIVELGIAMAVESDINRLAELILKGAKEIANADGGSLYLVNPDGNLDFMILLNDSLGFEQGGNSGIPVSLPPVPTLNPDGSLNHSNVVTHSYHTGKTINIEDAYNDKFFDFSGTRKFDEKSHYESHSFLTVPLRPRGGEVIGALQLINAKDGMNEETISFSAEIQRFVEALSAAAATSLFNRDLLETQKELFDSLIKFSAGAIDAKSHYTGGHCERVPEIALMLAKAAVKEKKGPLRDFSIETQEEWREFRIAAWLHDCGKMTTPEYVVDKATKLETLYNRIHEVRTRFEVLLRDAEIEKLQSIIDGGNQENAEHVFQERKDELQKDFSFIAECNLGDKYMEPEDIESIKRISAQTWTRNFDDTLGISWAEQNRVKGRSSNLLPSIEKLLADKPEHQIPRMTDVINNYSKYNFTLTVPELMYNQGELYNLSIKRGTLNSEERFKINEHVIQTIIMLENLPLPSSMNRVPEYAGTHHETLKGTGYPRGIDHSELPIPSRIMAIADIFEALTSSDRPYKRTKTLSKCIEILHRFKEDGDIDPVLFNLLLTSGVYRKYAEDYLQPGQIDDVSIDQYLG